MKQWLVIIAFILFIIFIVPSLSSFIFSHAKPDKHPNLYWDYDLDKYSTSDPGDRTSDN